MRNNIKKIFNCFLMIAILSVSICNTITYAKAESYTYSIGTNYGGIDTSEDATYSATVFSMAGYKSYYSTAPTVSYMLGNSPSGKPRLESNIIFLSGHGNHNHMHFNYLQSGGNYATGIIQGNHRVSETSGYEYAGINDYNMNNVELAILAGCQTASGMVEKPKLNEKKVMNDIYRKVSERYKVIKQDSKWIYDVNENKFKYIIFTDYIADKLGGLGRNEVCIEVD